MSILNTYGDLFYYEALEFYNSAKIVEESQNRFHFDQMLIGPISYQIRHSMELILKAYIISFEIESGNEHWNEKKYLAENKKLFSIHSLKALLNILDSEFVGKVDAISDEVRNTLIDVDSFDMDSTFFRYPCDKSLNTFLKDFNRAIDRKEFRTAPCGIGNFLYHNDFDYYADSEFNDDIIEVEATLFDMSLNLLEEYKRNFIEKQESV